MTKGLFSFGELGADFEAELIYERESEYNDSLEDDCLEEEMAAQEFELMWRE